MTNLRVELQKIFGKQLPIRQRFFNIIFLCGFIVGIAGVFTCINLNSSKEAIGISAAMTFVMPFFALLGIISKNRQEEILYFALGIINFVIFPSLYLMGGGIDCGIPSYFAIGLALTLFLTKGKIGIIMGIVEAIFYNLTFLFSYLVPSTISDVPAFATEEGKLDFTFNAIISNTLMVCLALGVLTRIIFKMYQRENTVVANSIEEVKRQSTIDPLTNVYNRRYMYSYLTEQMTAARISPESFKLSAVLFDIDKFKDLNDTYGHLLGDDVLKAISRILRDSCREGEIIARYGGEEFLLIMPNVSKDDAEKRANDIRECIAKSYLSPGLPEDKTVTISGGVSSYEKGMTEENIVAIADENLYKAKESGRNKICV